MSDPLEKREADMLTRSLVVLSREPAFRGLLRVFQGRKATGKAMPPLEDALAKEIVSMVEAASEGHRKASGSCVPVYLCGDVSHGLIDSEGSLRFGHEELEPALPCRP